MPIKYHANYRTYRDMQDKQFEEESQKVEEQQMSRWNSGNQNDIVVKIRNDMTKFNNAMNEFGKKWKTGDPNLRHKYDAWTENGAREKYAAEHMQEAFKNSIVPEI